jgi:hypothetical protein
MIIKRIIIVIGIKNKAYNELSVVVVVACAPALASELDDEFTLNKIYVLSTY